MHYVGQHFTCGSLSQNSITFLRPGLTIHHKLLKTIDHRSSMLVHVNDVIEWKLCRIVITNMKTYTKFALVHVCVPEKWISGQVNSFRTVVVIIQHYSLPTGRDDCRVYSLPSFEVNNFTCDHIHQHVWAVFCRCKFYLPYH